MDIELGEKPMKKIKYLLIFTLIILGVAGSMTGWSQTQTDQNQATLNYYKMDAERRIEGAILAVSFETRYENKSAFLVIIIEDKKTGQIFNVEVSPAWFFDRDLHKGETVKIIGSYYSKDGTNYLIARQIRAGGEIFNVRDSRGFPNWRGAPASGKGWRRGKGL